MTKQRTAEEVIELYFERAWNACEAELVRDICANPVIRHYADKTLEMRHDEQIERIRQRHATNVPNFKAIIRTSDGTHVTTVWNNVYANGEKTCGIEVFKVIDGRITDVWNPVTIDKGNWA
jgi:hypothetical protein